MTSNHSQGCMNNNCNPLVNLVTVINIFFDNYCVYLCPVGAWIEANHFCLEVYIIWGNGLTPVTPPNDVVESCRQS